MGTIKCLLWGSINVLYMTFCFGSVSGPVDLLPVIADGLETNLEKIRTWKGSAEWNYYILAELDDCILAELDDGRVIQNEETSKRTFWIDQNQMIFRNSSKIIRTNENQPETAPSVYRLESAMEKDKTYFTLFQEDPNDISPRRLMIMKNEGVENIRRWTGGFVLNPRGILQQMIFNLPRRFREKYRLISEGTYKPSYGEVSVSREGDLITVYLSLAADDTFGLLENHCVFDASIGFNMVSYKRTNALQKETWQVSYMPVKDVFLPTAITYFSEDQINQEKMSKSSITIKTEILNEPLEESELSVSLSQMGMRKGDYIVDHTKGGIVYAWDPDKPD